MTQPLPHRYLVEASAGPEGGVVLASAGLEPLHTAAPAEFDGPGDRWSPETLLVGAIADCFVLGFRAVARSARLAWLSLEVEVVGTLERVEGAARFTHFAIEARLRIPVEGDRAAAGRVLHRAEAGCLVSNSLSGRRQLTVEIEAVAAAA
jgi:organic hydroperoxide reductase OsmC/OhrA